MEVIGRKVMTNLDSIIKSRDITWPTKVRLVKAMVFPVLMYGCESWTIEKAEPRRIDVFELWCWRKLLRVPWTSRRSNQSILNEISPGCSLEGLMLKLKLQYFGHLMWRADSFGPDPLLSNCDPLFGSVQSLSRVQLFATPWTAACQASLSITSSRSPPKPRSIESVIPSNHLILCRPLLLPPSISSSHQVAKVLEF